MRRRERSDPDRSNSSDGFLSMMSVMFLLVPALLLMAQMVPMTSIDTRPPRFRWGPDDESTPPQTIVPPMEVVIGRDGFFVRDARGEPFSRIGSPGPGHDLAALRAAARVYKQQFPDQPKVEITADASARYELLIETLDAVRGEECRLAGAHRGEPVPDECLLWVPIVAGSNPDFVEPADSRS